jgi:hypothetical protein
VRRESPTSVRTLLSLNSLEKAKRHVKPRDLEFSDSEKTCCPKKQGYWLECHKTAISSLRSPGKCRGRCSVGFSLDAPLSSGNQPCTTMHDHACAWERSWVATNSDKQRHARKAGAVHVDFGLRHSYLLATRLVIKDIGPSTWSPENFRHSAFISGSILLSGEFVGLALIHTCESAGQTGKSRKAQFYCQMSSKTRRDNTLRRPTLTYLVCSHRPATEVRAVRARVCFAGFPGLFSPGPITLGIPPR